MSKRKATAISLPLSRTAKIMTSAVGVESVNQDIVALATKATEIFLADFVCRAFDQASDEEFRSNTLEYDDIQKLVHSDPRYDFLMDTIPKRIKFSEAVKLVEEANKREAAAKIEDEARKEAKRIEQARKQEEAKKKAQSQLDNGDSKNDDNNHEKQSNHNHPPDPMDTEKKPTVTMDSE